MILKIIAVIVFVIFLFILIMILSLGSIWIRTINDNYDGYYDQEIAALNKEVNNNKTRGD